MKVNSEKSLPLRRQSVIRARPGSDGGESFWKGISKFPLFLVFLLCGLFFTTTWAVKIKDVGKVEGIADYQVTGFGLVVGLRNTGDGSRTIFTNKGVVNMLRNLGIEVNSDRVRLRNVAAVMVVANLSPYLRKGSQVDVVVSSIGDARSLEGGTLLMSTLTGADGKTYAMAQGPVSIGGFNVESQTGLAAVRKNHALVGRVPNGAIVQKELVPPDLSGENLKFLLNEPDFTTAVNMADAINKAMGEDVARPESAGLVTVQIAEDRRENVLTLVSTLENVDFAPARVARVVLNEKTGTIVAGGDISISPVAISHGSITINITGREDQQITTTQSSLGATTTATQSRQEQARVEEPKAEVKVFPQITNVSELAQSLNSLGVTPRDIISIFQSIKRAGALHAELVTM